jgi:RHS repeat-associated protein
LCSFLVQKSFRKETDPENYDLREDPKKSRIVVGISEKDWDRLAQEKLDAEAKRQAEEDEQHALGILPLNDRLPEHDDYSGVIYRMKWRYRGGRHYELCNHLGNVQVVVTDKKIAHSFGGLDWAYYTADVLSAHDQYAFGYDIEERGFERTDNQYRYGFNGKEKSDEIASNDYDFGARIYDGRLGRWLGVDALEKKYPSLSPYVFAVNSPNHIIYVDGRDIIVLSSPQEAASFGHAAVLIGNDKEGWRLYSKNGTNGSGSQISSGESNKYPEKGILFASLNEFANSKSNFHDGEAEYTSAFRITSTAKVDEKMEAAALLQVDAYYNTLSASCIDVCTDALRAGGFNDGMISKAAWIPQSDPGLEVLLPVVPRVRFINIVQGNKGTDVTPQIQPTQETKAKYKEAYVKKERNEEILKSIKGPSTLDRVKNSWKAIKDTVKSALKEAERKIYSTATPR